jgi:TrmH family RNA methyltransferase
MKTVTSKDNPDLKKARKLLTNKGRTEASAFLVEGLKLIDEAVRAGFDTEIVFINAGAFLRGEAKSGEYPKEMLLEEKLFLDLAQTKTPQPYMAIIKKDNLKDRKRTAAPVLGSVLILDRISDPGNVGTLIRTALAAGIDEVWCVKGTADVFSDKAVRASAGAVFHMTLREGLSAKECISFLRRLKMKLLVCDVNGKNMYDTRMTDRLAIAIGNESAGPQDEFLKKADQIVRVPMEDMSESLNVAACGAIVMYETRRQRRQSERS